MGEFSDSRFDARVWRQAVALAEDGWQVTLVMYREDVPRLVRREDRGVTVWECPMPGRYASGSPRRDLVRRARMLGVLLRMAWRSIRLPGDVYWAHNFVLGWALWLGAALRGARFVYDAHEIAWEAREFHFRVGTHVERWLLRRADLRLCPSDARARLIAERYGVPAPVTIGNYPDVAPRDGSDRLRAELNLPAEVPILYYSGAFALSTRLQDRVVKALPSLEKPAVFVLVGTAHPAEQERLEALAQALGVGDRLRILPPQPHAEMLRYTASADVGICLLKDAGLAYRYHALNKFYEYVACGLPVLASDLPTFRDEVLGDGTGPIGALCDPDDPDSVVRALNGLLRDRAALAAMGARARQSAETRWNWRLEAERLRQAARGLEGADSGAVAAEETAGSTP
jgi:glycosyltransferase involved in cell wall biosynthesis